MSRDVEHDVERILEKWHHKGGDFWATPDGRVYVENPYSTISSLLMLHELGVEASHEAVRGGLELILERHRGPKGLRFCERGHASEVATIRVEEIEVNLRA